MSTYTYSCCGQRQSSATGIYFMFIFLGVQVPISTNWACQAFCPLRSLGSLNFCYLAGPVAQTLHDWFCRNVGLRVPDPHTIGWRELFSTWPSLPLMSASSIDRITLCPQTFSPGPWKRSPVVAGNPVGPRGGRPRWTLVLPWTHG